MQMNIGIKVCYDDDGQKNLRRTMEAYFEPYVTKFKNFDEARSILVQVGAQFGFSIRTDGKRWVAHGTDTTNTYQLWTSINSDKDHRSVVVCTVVVCTVYHIEVCQ